jgi:hypothetical protein
MGPVLDTTLCDKVCQLLATGRWFSTGSPLFSNNKTFNGEAKHSKVTPNILCKHSSICVDRAPCKPNPSVACIPNNV